jgi:hypothetical protein
MDIEETMSPHPPLHTRDPNRAAGLVGVTYRGVVKRVEIVGSGVEECWTREDSESVGYGNMHPES